MSLHFSLMSPGDLWWFHTKGDPSIFELINETPQIHQNYADLIYRDQKILKRIRPQKRVDPYRKYFRSQALREFRGSIKLEEIGLLAPKPFGYGINLTPLGCYESVLLMEYIPNIGTLREVFREEPDPSVREILLKKLGRDLQRMVEARIYHKDAHFGNVLVTPDHDLVWIDNDLAPIKGPDESKRLLKKFRATPLLDEEEKSAFLPDHLPG
ncbi:lipopolysaccharide kinase InaA family protein [Nitratifractor sp.]